MEEQIMMLLQQLKNNPGLLKKLGTGAASAATNISGTGDGSIMGMLGGWGGKAIGNAIAPGIGGPVGQVAGSFLLKGFGKAAKKGIEEQKLQTSNPFADGGTGYKHGGNTDMAKYHNMSQEDYDAMIAMMMKKGYKYGGIHIKPENRGLLHKNLGVPEGQNLTAEQIAIKPGDSEAIRKRKQFAINARSWHHGGKDGGYTSIMQTLKKY